MEDLLPKTSLSILKHVAKPTEGQKKNYKEYLEAIKNKLFNFINFDTKGIGIGGHVFASRVAEDKKLAEEYSKIMVKWILKHKFATVKLPDVRHHWRYTISFYFFIKHPKRQEVFEVFKDYCENGLDNLKNKDSYKIVVDYVKQELCYTCQMQGRCTYFDELEEEIYEDYAQIVQLREEQKDPLFKDKEELEETIQETYEWIKHFPSTEEEFFKIKT